MSDITRRGLAEEIDMFDDQIADLQQMKSGAYQAYRSQLKEAGLDKETVSKELAAFKKAIRISRDLRDNAAAVAEKDALIGEIIAEIGTVPATRAPARTRKTAAPSPTAPTPPVLSRPSVEAPASLGAAPVRAAEHEGVPDFLDRRRVVA